MVILKTVGAKVDFQYSVLEFRGVSNVLIDDLLVIPLKIPNIRISYCESTIFILLIIVALLLNPEFFYNTIGYYLELSLTPCFFPALHVSVFIVSCLNLPDFFHNSFQIHKGKCLYQY